MNLWQPAVSRHLVSQSVVKFTATKWLTQNCHRWCENPQNNAHKPLLLPTKPKKNIQKLRNRHRTTFSLQQLLFTTGIQLSAVYIEDARPWIRRTAYAKKRNKFHQHPDSTIITPLIRGVQSENFVFFFRFFFLSAPRYNNYPADPWHN